MPEVSKEERESALREREKRFLRRVRDNCGKDVARQAHILLNGEDRGAGESILDPKWREQVLKQAAEEGIVFPLV